MAFPSTGAGAGAQPSALGAVRQPGDIHVQLEVLSGLQVFAPGEFVPAPQVGDTDTEFLRDAVQGITTAHPVMDGAHDLYCWCASEPP